MKTAQQSAEKFVSRAGVASGDYAKGAQESTKDQAALAIAAKALYLAGVQEAATKGRFEKGLQKSGKSGWLNGVLAKGQNRFAEGVSASSAKYATESARFDTARNAAASLPRGLKGSETNFARSKAVALAQRAVKVGAAA